MYKIMLAEDEPEVLTAIMDTIRWEDFSFLPPVGCRDGRDAIAALENGFTPDALITDICMPFVDGLDLTRYVMERFPRTVVVVLSGYDEFMYAQQALKLKVYDYVLKPVTPASIKTLLGRISEELDTRKINDIEDSMHILKRHFLTRLSTRRLDARALEENCRRHKIHFPNGRHLVMVMDMDKLLTFDVDFDGSVELARYGLYNIADELIGEDGEALVFQGQDGLVNAIISGENSETCLARAESLARLVSGAVKQHLTGTVSVGIGQPVDLPGKLYLSRRQAVDALSHRFFSGENSILHFADIGGFESADVDFSSYYRGFESALKAFDKSGAGSVIAGLFQKLRKIRRPLDGCVLCCQKMIVLLHDFVDQFGGNAEMQALERMWEESGFHEAATIGQLEERLKFICESLLDLFGPIHADSSAAMVMRAESYIRDNYSDPGLSLQSITEHLAISVSHFSAVFKSRTGCTFVEYLTSVRMAKAKQMLALSDRRTYETAEAVGYSDPHYFSAAFKRYTGMNPKEYREYSKTRSHPGADE